MTTSPDHYQGAGLECIDAIFAMLGRDGFIAFCRGNSLKYRWRYERKDGAADLAKARVYERWAEDGNPAWKPIKTQARTVEAIEVPEPPPIMGRLEGQEAD